MSEPNEVIHQSTRLRIVAALATISESEVMDFSQLKGILEVTDGNLGSHIATLEKASYVSVKKSFAGKKPLTQIALTRKGRKEFNSHVNYLREIIDSN
jgi:DNA-binding MarR family transcriptional regulator